MHPSTVSELELRMNEEKAPPGHQQKLELNLKVLIMTHVYNNLKGTVAEWVKSWIPGIPTLKSRLDPPVTLQY